MIGNKIETELQKLVEEAREMGYGAYYSISIFLNCYSVAIYDQNTDKRRSRIYFANAYPEDVRKDFYDLLTSLKECREDD